VEDLSLVMEILARPASHDSEVPPVSWRTTPLLQLRDLRIAWTSTFPGMLIASEIRSAVEHLASELDLQGARVEECLPQIDANEHTRLMNQLFNLIIGAFAETRSSLVDYLTALQLRDDYNVKWEQFFNDWDIFLCPAHNITARHYTDEIVMVDGQELNLDEVSSPLDLSPATGLPSVVIPLTRDSHGLPIGVQLIGRRWDDERLLAVAGLISGITGGFHSPPGY
jgi:amidase